MHVLPLAALVIIRLYDTYGIPPADTRAAMRTAGAVLATASVKPAWVVCPVSLENADGCGIADVNEMFVRIVRSPKPNAEDDRLGYASVDTAMRHGVLATVFADRVTSLAARARTDRATLLGYAIAHEVGHLLIGTIDHASAGVMRPHWSARDLQIIAAGQWRFSRAEAAAMVSAAASLAARAPALPPPARADRSASPDASESLRATLACDPRSARTPSVLRPASCPPELPADAPLQ